MEKSGQFSIDIKPSLSVIAVLFYAGMFLESRYNFIFVDGDLSGRTLLAVFVGVTIFSAIASVFAFDGAFRAKKNRIGNFIVLILLTAALSCGSLYFVSNNLLFSHQSNAYEINGVRNGNQRSVFYSDKSLYLNNRGIYKVPPKIYRLAELHSLGLEGNQIEHISPQIGFMKAMIDLRFSRNHLSALPYEVSLLPLKHLDLTGNQFITFPEGFRFPASLEVLFLGHNQLRSLANSLADCPSLKHLNLWGNQLTELPVTFGDLSQLESLTLIENKFTEFPTVVLKCKKLTYLSLSHNKISRLPMEIVTLANLTTLHLGDNPIPQEQIEELRRLMPSCKITFDR